jgi:hypothetical protein
MRAPPSLFLSLIQFSRAATPSLTPLSLQPRALGDSVMVIAGFWIPEVSSPSLSLSLSLPPSLPVRAPFLPARVPWRLPARAPGGGHAVISWPLGW